MPNWYDNQKTTQSIYRAKVDIKFAVPVLENIEEEKNTALSALEDSLNLSSDLTFHITQLDKIL